MKKWIILNKQKTLNNKQKTGEEIVKILLKNRGITKKKDIEEFLHPSLDQLNLTDLLIDKKELDKAVKRIYYAIKNGESIIVYTDYDVDGLCSGAIVWETLYNLGAKVMPYVPNRMEEGYGLSKKGIDYVKKEYKTSLIITVDHGVTSSENIDYAKRLGIDSIIIDHHLPGSKIPKTNALVHTTKLCATGVAWVFCNYLTSKTKKLKSIQYDVKDLDLVALATIADLVPLTGANRTLVIYGLRQLNKTSRIGLKTLVADSGLKNGDIGIFEVGHVLAPRINAMGRLTHALDVLRLLCTKDQARAKILAALLNTTNKQRQIQTGESVLHAMKLVNNQLIVKNAVNNKLIFLADESYHQGVIGLVAGKLAEEFYLPAIVISKGEKYSKASARSINGFNIVNFLRKAEDLLEDVGGHPMAAGFTVKTDNIIKLQKKLTRVVQIDLDKDKLTQVIKIDLEIDLSFVTQELYQAVKTLSPFGMGNPQPIFVSRNVKVVGASLVGKDKQHLKLTIRSRANDHNNRKMGLKYDDNIFQVIGFGMGAVYKKIYFDKLIDIAYTIDEDRWNGNNRLQLKLKDVKVHD